MQGFKTTPRCHTLSYTPIHDTGVVILSSVLHIHFSAGANKEAKGISGNLAAK